MAEEDYSVTSSWRNSVRFADLYNGTVFRGKQVLSPRTCRTCRMRTVSRSWGLTESGG